MSISETIRNRRTTNQFKEQKLPQETVLRLLNDAVWAPNHGLREPWRFIFAAEEGKSQLVNSLYNILLKGKFKGADEEQKAKWLKYANSVPAYLVVVMPEAAHPHIRDEDMMAAASLVQNFQLAAWDEGIGMLWHTGEYIYNKDFRNTLGVQPGEKIIAVLHMGFVEKAGAARPRTPAEERFTVL
ncbi:nitroreductase family protein [Paenibacillus taiwanensis]|uniref:nitroreductase family protein n=1 Tax=Paenibacillus taiwanensis TaxID=401638 RepID=UPI00041FB401|nr:nitroreductase [Paenibacillus taiwanensis]